MHNQSPIVHHAKDLSDFFQDGYDPSAIDAYFRQNPSAILQRGQLVAFSAVRVLACLASRNYT